MYAYLYDHGGLCTHVILHVPCASSREGFQYVQCVGPSMFGRMPVLPHRAIVRAVSSQSN